MLGSYFAAKVRGRRHELRIRQVDLARLAGVSVDTIVAVEAGTLPGLRVALDIARALAVELRDLVPTNDARGGPCNRCLLGTGQHSKWCAEQAAEQERRRRTG